MSTRNDRLNRYGVTYNNETNEKRARPRTGERMNEQTSRQTNNQKKTSKTKITITKDRLSAELLYNEQTINLQQPNVIF